MDSSTTEHTHTLSTGPQLAYTLHLPSSSHSPLTKAALVAHPYGRLGGTRNDHVVVSLARALAEEGWAVVRYDARGAGDSGGSASWTGAAEATDFEELVDRVVRPLFSSSSDPSTPSQHSSINPPHPQSIELLLCGYSFGALAASSCPPPASTDSLKITTSYLLISYPLSVLWALSFFQSGPFTTALNSLVRSGQNRILAVFGDCDQFSDVGKLRTWAKGLEEIGAEWSAAEGLIGAISYHPAHVLFPLYFISCDYLGRKITSYVGCTGLLAGALVATFASGKSMLMAGRSLFGDGGSLLTSLFRKRSKRSLPSLCRRQCARELSRGRGELENEKKVVKLGSQAVMLYRSPASKHVLEITSLRSTAEPFVARLSRSSSLPPPSDSLIFPPSCTSSLHASCYSRVTATSSHRPTPPPRPTASFRSFEIVVGDEACTGRRRRRWHGEGGGGCSWRARRSGAGVSSVRAAEEGGVSSAGEGRAVRRLTQTCQRMLLCFLPSALLSPSSEQLAQQTSDWRRPSPRPFLPSCLPLLPARSDLPTSDPPSAMKQRDDNKPLLPYAHSPSSSRSSSPPPSSPVLSNPLASASAFLASKRRWLAVGCVYLLLATAWYNGLHSSVWERASLSRFSWRALPGDRLVYDAQGRPFPVQSLPIHVKDDLTATTSLGPSADAVFHLFPPISSPSPAVLLSTLESFLVDHFPAADFNTSDPTSLINDLRSFFPSPSQPPASAQIPHTIWQTAPNAAYRDQKKRVVETWQKAHPDWDVVFHDNEAADEWVRNRFDLKRGLKRRDEPVRTGGGDLVATKELSSSIEEEEEQGQRDGFEPEMEKGVIAAWDRLTQPAVLRSDFWRYLVLAVEGGVYADTDVECLKPVGNWSEDVSWEGVKPEGFVPASLIVGIEADVGGRKDWHDWWPRPLQISQWTMASARGHPVLLDTVRRIVESSMLPTEEQPTSVMEKTGPGPFTDAVLSYLLSQYRKPWGALRELSSDGWRFRASEDAPELLQKGRKGKKHEERWGDVKVLSITGFSPGVGHMGAHDRSHKAAMASHLFAGSWKQQKGAQD